MRTLDTSLGEGQESPEGEDSHRRCAVREHGGPAGIIRNGERHGPIKATGGDERVGDLHGLTRTQRRGDVRDCEIDRDDFDVSECAEESQDRSGQVIAGSATWPNEQLSGAHGRYHSAISARKDELVDECGGNGAGRLCAEIRRQR